MADHIEIRGVAIPFGVACQVGRLLEFADRESFAAELARGARPALTFQDHDADPIGRVTELFLSDAGLCFRAEIAAEIWREIRFRVCDRKPQYATNYCSLSMLNLEHDRIRSGDRVFHRIRAATIEHIAITDKSAVYADTGAWPAIVNGDLPRRLARLAEHWERGHAAHVEAQRRAQAKAAAARKRPAADAAKLPPSRLAAYAAIRRSVAARIAAGAPWDRLIGCAAFSRAGGFDGTAFDREIQAAAGRQIGGLRR